MHLFPDEQKKNGFTLIELLVVIAIIAILSVVVVLTLNPAELLRQARDSSRLSDVATLNNALGVYSTDVPGGNIGSSSIIYISVPDASATSTMGDQCQGSMLPVITTSTGWNYHCALSSNSRAINGTGWLPVNFNLISSGSPIGSLPIDPVNNTSSGLYYEYSITGGQYQLIALMESQKYKSTVNGPLGNGIDVAGTSPNISPIVWWNLDEGSGSSTLDLGTGGNGGTWSGASGGVNSTHYTAAKVGAWAGYFDGSSNFISSVNNINIGSAFTVIAWVSSNNVFVSNYTRIVESNYVTGFFLGLNNANTQFDWIVNNSNLNTCAGGTLGNQIWQQVAGVYNGSGTIYVNGSPVIGNCTMPTPSVPNNKITVGITATNHSQGAWNGKIDDVRIYNRALSPAEIQAIYNSQK